MMATEKPEPYCGANAMSDLMPGHTHYCRLPAGHVDDPRFDDQDGGHVCSKCKTWWWLA